ncbi:MAG: pentapeptide repeat-containing protein [Alphaproteobacteria bacterium]|nr:pentapeptide repeat-containing protein [Alphaproteobacteria bacterium]
MEQARFLKTSLACSDMVGANIEKMLMCRANPTSVVLERANAARADLSSVNLTDAMIVGAKVNDVNLSGATLKNNNLRGTDLHGDSMDNVDLPMSKLTGAQLIPDAGDRSRTGRETVADHELWVREQGRRRQPVSIGQGQSLEC